MLHGHHLRDDQLLECYLAVRAGETMDPRSADHLSDCESCAARHAHFALFMDDVRSELDHETDAIFTPDRLRLQQQQIAARLEHLAHPAHVISFPPRVGRHMTTAASRVAPRWIAAAAAAGLFIGVAVGRFLDLGSPADRFGHLRMPAAASATAHVMPPTMTALGASDANIGPTPVAEVQIADDEDVFLSELELALERPRTHELRPFDAFTPRVRDAVIRLR